MRGTDRPVSPSPILDILQPSPTLTTERALSLLPLTPAVRSTDGISAWESEELRQACSGTTREGFAHGLSAQELQRLLAGGYVIKLRRGDRLIRREQTTRTLYVVLSGALEVRDGERTVTVE